MKNVFEKDVVKIDQPADTRIAVYDLEYTAWPLSQAHRWSDPGEYREVVQIGAVILAVPSLDEVRSLSVYVRPHINPRLSDFFIDLTGITQETVDREGVPFEKAMETFREWAGGLPMFSWGRSDDAVLRENCELESLPFPFRDDRFFNIRDVFRLGGIEESKYNSGTILQAFGKELPYQAHDGLNDTRTIALALQELPDAANLIAQVLRDTYPQ